ncbi:cation efflux family-domain-containing protein [Pilobolus umbonatus]|nr:cation efflux family-domain-containing protein [Pilobolus umbonatus]
MIGLTGSFFIVEIVVGYYVSSLALVAKRNRYDPKYSYGWQRAEILGALVNGVFLFALCFTIFIESIERFVTPDPVTDPLLVLIVGGVGLLANLLGLFIFHDHSHGHGHGHHMAELPEVHDLELAPSVKDDHHQKGHLNMKGVFLHILGDALGNVGVIASGLFIWLTDYEWRYYSDPVMSMLLSIIIFASAVPLVRQTSFILLQGVPNSVPLEHMNASLLKLDGVLSVHELHVWQLSDTKLVASFHVLLESRQRYMALGSEIRKILHGYGIHSATIQPEFIEDHQEKHTTTVVNENSIIEVISTPSNHSTREKPYSSEVSLL